MSQAYHEGYELLYRKGLGIALRTAEKRWLDAEKMDGDITYQHHCYAVYCYLKGYEDAISAKS